MHEIIKDYIQIIGDSVETIGIAVIITGFILATIFAIRSLWAGEMKGHALFRSYRQNLARSILLGLEFLVAGDIIRTVAGDLTLIGVATLGGVVLIRIALGLALQAEVEPRSKKSKPRLA